MTGNVTRGGPSSLRLSSSLRGVADWPTATNRNTSLYHSKLEYFHFREGSERGTNIVASSGGSSSCIRYVSTSGQTTHPGRLNWGNVCCHFVRNIFLRLSYPKVKEHITIILLLLKSTSQHSFGFYSAKNDFV